LELEQLNESNPNLTQSDSVQIGDNAIGPSTGDIIINSGSNDERCSMCKTPIDAQNNPGVFCFKEGCNTLFCTNCESFFRAKREPGEKPYCSNHISEFVGAPIPSFPPGLEVKQTSTAPKPVMIQPTQTVVNQPIQQAYPTRVHQQPQPVQIHQQGSGMMQVPTHGVYGVQHNPYVNQQMIDPITALIRTIKSWNGEGRAQRSEYWWGSLGYSFALGFMMAILMLPLSIAFVGNNQTESSYMILTSVFMIILFILYIPLLSQTIRRLHDAGYSGWYLALIFIPYLGYLILFIICLLPSQPHPNRFG